MISPFGETFLTLDIGSGRTDALYFHIKKDRRLVVEKFEEDIDLAKFLKSPLRRAAHASWEGEYFFDRRRKIAVAADSKHATTIPVPISWQREQERRHLPLALEEVDDHIGRVFPKLLAECRAEAARRFGADALDAVLVAARAEDAAVDRRKAPRGEGIIGTEVSLILELTFAARSLYDRFHSFFNSPAPFFFMESAQARLALLAPLRRLPLNLVVGGTGGEEGSLFVLQAALPLAGLGSGGKEKYPVLYREKFPWPFGRMLDGIATAFSVSRRTAEDMYQMYLEDRISARVRQEFEALIAPWTAKFAASLKKAKVRGGVFIDAPYPVPYALPHHEGRAVFETFPLEEVFRKFNLALIAGPLADRPHILLRHLAPFLAMYFDRTQGLLNQELRKRVHWLAR